MLFRSDVARYLHEQGRVPVEDWRRLWVKRRVAVTVGEPEWVKAAEATGRIPVVEDPDKIAVFVAGADVPIPQHAYFPTWGFPDCRVVRPVEVPLGWDTMLAQRPAP